MNTSFNVEIRIKLSRLVEFQLKFGEGFCYTWKLYPKESAYFLKDIQLLVHSNVETAVFSVSLHDSRISKVADLERPFGSMTMSFAETIERHRKVTMPPYFSFLFRRISEPSLTCRKKASFTIPLPKQQQKTSFLGFGFTEPELKCE